MNGKRTIILLLGLVLYHLICQNVDAAPLKNVPVTLTQPDSKVIHVFASGDEFYNWLHDKDDFTIVQDSETGYYVYAVKASDGELVPSKYIVGEVDPAIEGLEKSIHAPPKKPGLKKASSFVGAQSYEDHAISFAPATGTINNIVVFIRFSDETEFSDSLSYYDAMFNSTTAGANSMRNYFKEVSYNKLTISTTFYPSSNGMVISYKDSHPRSYYEPYNLITNWGGYRNDDDRTTREHALLKNAINAVKSQIPISLNIDADGDGDVDGITFIIKGGPNGWSSLLWPHQWFLTSQDVFINGVHAMSL